MNRAVSDLLSRHKYVFRPTVVVLTVRILSPHHLEGKRTASAFVGHMAQAERGFGRCAKMVSVSYGVGIQSAGVASTGGLSRGI